MIDRVRKLSGIAAVLFTLLLPGACTPPGPSPLASGDPPTAVTSSVSGQLKQATITVKGLVCQGCAQAASDAAMKVPGVESAESNFQNGTVSVRYDETQTDAHTIAGAIEAVERAPASAFEAEVITNR